MKINWKYALMSLGALFFCSMLSIACSDSEEEAGNTCLLYTSLGGGGGTFVVDAYPVSVHAWDVLLIFVTVLTVGFLSVWYPVRYLSKRLL